MANQPNQAPQQEFTPLSGVLLRTYWFFVGHAVVTLLAVKIFQEHGQRSIIYNSAFFLAAGSVFLVRFIDVKFFKGETGDGRKATMADFGKWSLKVAVAYGIVYAVLHLAGALLK